MTSVLKIVLALFLFFFWPKLSILDYQPTEIFPLKKELLHFQNVFSLKVKVMGISRTIYDGSPTIRAQVSVSLRGKSPPLVPEEAMES